MIEKNEVINIKGWTKKWRQNREVLVTLFILLKENKKWWLFPILLVFALLSFFIALTGNQALLPAIYALF